MTLLNCWPELHTAHGPASKTASQSLSAENRMLEQGTQMTKVLVPLGVHCVTLAKSRYFWGGGGGRGGSWISPPSDNTSRPQSSCSLRPPDTLNIIL